MELLVLVLPDTPRHNIRFTGLCRGFVVMASGTFLLDQETTTSVQMVGKPEAIEKRGFAEIGRANSTPVARHFSQADFWPPLLKVCSGA